MRYKAHRNGLPVVLQITSLPSENTCVSDLSQISLCQGIREEDFLKSASLDNPMSVMNTVFIERIGDDNVYRSRDCQQLVQDKARCSACEDLVISDGINQDVL